MTVSKLEMEKGKESGGRINLIFKVAKLVTGIWATGSCKAVFCEDANQVKITELQSRDSPWKSELRLPRTEQRHQVQAGETPYFQTPFLPPDTFSTEFRCSVAAQLRVSPTRGLPKLSQSLANKNFSDYSLFY